MRRTFFAGSALILALGCEEDSSSSPPLDLRQWAEDFDIPPYPLEPEPQHLDLPSHGQECPPGTEERVLDSGAYTCPLLDADGNPVATTNFAPGVMPPTMCALPLSDKAAAKAACDTACVLNGVERACQFEATAPQPTGDDERTCCSAPCLVGEDSDDADNGPDVNPASVDHCNDHLHVQACSQRADTDVLAIHDAQPMVEASVLSNATTQPLPHGLGCNADVGLKTQRSESTGKAETGDANYTFSGAPGCESEFSVGAHNIIAALTTAGADADFSLELSIGDAYSYTCSCEPGSILGDTSPEQIDACTPQQPELRCTVDETFEGNPLQQSGGQPNVIGGCPMLLSNPTFTTGSTITLAASSSGTIAADNTDPRFDDATHLRVFVSTFLDVHDACGNTATVTLEDDSDPVSCGGRKFGDPPPEVDCTVPQMPFSGDFNGDGLTNQVDLDEFAAALTAYTTCLSDEIEAGGGEDHVAIEQSYACTDLCQDEPTTLTCREPEDDPTLCAY
ncbi:MAG: hypothetical protein K0V04_24025 [Deltaproteobacteria bacterium]|nr:hypothetical protein [Deltaproteobacteria bacterium]